MAEGIKSRGIPSKYSLYFPPHNSEELRNFQDKDENITRNLWNIDEIINFVFSKKYQPTYYDVSLKFMQKLCSEVFLEGPAISEFVNGNSISKATFYNRVLPRLKRAGMIKIERKTIVAVESKRKYRPMIVSLSKTFGNYLFKISDSWLAVVDDARTRKK